MVDGPEYARWRKDAGSALRSAELQADAKLHNWACFAAEQAAQLATKALLHGLGAAPWGHDLEELGRRLAEAGVPVPEASWGRCCASSAITYRRAMPTPIPAARPPTSTSNPMRAGRSRMPKPF